MEAIRVAFGSSSRTRQFLPAMLFAVGAASPALAQYTLTTLAAFDGSNGAAPYCAPTVVGNTLYGTTTIGGGAYGGGTVFSLPITGGGLTTLVNFNGSNGGQPNTGLTALGSTLYGTTELGTGNDGTVFSVPITGGAPTTLVYLSTIKRT